MAIVVGDTVPEARFIRMGKDGPEQVDLYGLTQGRKVVLFALPGAFTPTCHAAHLPSFIRTADALRAKGVDDIACVSVNDPHVMRFWGELTGADNAGILMLADADGSFTESVGMAFDAPAAGFFGRSKRYAMLIEDGVVTRLNEEPERGVCDLSGGETLLAQID
jgi:glutaredoxin/glutathione-dependent peroxiredoxin